LLPKREILQNEVFSGPKSSDEPAEKVAKQHNHGKSLLDDSTRADR
jgi:hypothetical protein